MKKMLLGAAGIVLLVAAGLVAFGLYRKHQGHDVRGSSTEEFVTTQAAPKPPPPTAKIRWPMYRFDATRQGNAEKMLVQPPYKPLWFFRAGSLLEFPPAVAYGRLYFANAKGVLYALVIKTREGALGLPRPPLHRRLAGGRQPHRLHDLPEQAALQRDPLWARRRGGGDQRRHRQAALAPEDRPDRVVAARARRGRLRRRLERPRLRDERRLGRDALDVPDRRQGQGRRRLLGRPRLLRLLRPPRLRAQRAHREARLEARRPSSGSATAAPSTRLRPSPTTASTSARPTARSTPSAPPAASCAGRTAPAATSTPRRPSSSSASMPARSPATSTASTPPPATCAGSTGRTGRSPARRS